MRFILTLPIRLVLISIQTATWGNLSENGVSMQHKGGTEILQINKRAYFKLENLVLYEINFKYPEKLTKLKILTSDII